MGPKVVGACCGLVLVRAQAGVPVPLEASCSECTRLCHLNWRSNGQWLAKNLAMPLRVANYLPAATSIVADLMLSRFGKFLSRYSLPWVVMAPWSGPRPCGAPSP